jgi:hypothetical protein
MLLLVLLDSVGLGPSFAEFDGYCGDVLQIRFDLNQFFLALP